MTHDHSKEVERLFQLAADLAPSARRSFLDEHCPSGSGIRREIEELLGHFEDAHGGFLETPPHDIRLSDVEPSGLPPNIGDYPVLGELGRGGMGVVFLATDPRLERQIALKVLPRQVADDPEWQKRFQREARLLASVSHPNIATVYSLESADDLHFLTMELVEGELLAGYIGGHPVPLGEALAICQQVAAALEAAHKRGVVHRDLKPTNVMINAENLVKVLDFGLAKSVRSNDGLTAHGQVAGTPGYMSPEQLRGSPVDQRADVWAFGCLLFECLSGRTAFPGPSAADSIAATLEGDPDWATLPDDVPDRVRKLLAGCLAKRADDRLGTMTAARREIEETIALLARGRLVPGDRTGRADAMNNLPLHLSSFVGRELEIRTLKDLLSGNRLVTLTGSAGCGKSRLALEAGVRVLDRFADGVWQVDLSTVADPALVQPALASGLGLRDEAGRSVADAIFDHLRTRQLLLVLDNCDRVLTEVAHLADTVLRQSPGVRILVTSRENLGITGEAPYPVPPLSIPVEGASPSDLDASEAAALFLARASAVSPGFILNPGTARAVAGICQRLDGIPLALELAAARVKVLSVEAIARRLDDRFRLLTGGSKTSLPHHRTLRDSIDWSHDQLEGNEQLFFRRLCVFAGGWTLDAAEAVCSGEGVESWEVLDVLSRLVDKSLVEMAAGADGDGERARYRMLETIREYAGARLSADGEETDIRRRHRDFYRDLAVEAHPHLLAGGDLESWLAQFDREQENLRLAIDTSLSAGEPVAALAITASLARYLQLRGHWSEGRTLSETVLAAPGAKETPSTELAQVLHRAGGLAQAQNDAPTAHAYFDESIRVWREIGEDRGLAGSLSNKGLLCSYEGQYDAARQFYEQALEINQRLGNRPWEASNLVNLGIIAADHGDFDEARGFYERGLTIARERDDHLLQAVILDNLATVLRNDDDMGRARDLHEESLAIYRRLGHRKGIATTLTNLGTLAHEQGDLASALSLLKESLELKQEIGDRRGVIYALESLASLITELGHPARGARLFGASGEMRERIGLPLSPKDRGIILNESRPTRIALGEADFETEVAKGKAMSEDAVVRFALETTESPRGLDP